MQNREQAFYVTLGKALRIKRAGKDLTQEALGAIVGLSRTSITNIEQGNQPVSAYLLCEFAHSLGCSVGELLPAESASAEGGPQIPDDVPRKAAEAIKRASRLVKS